MRNIALIVCFLYAQTLVGQLAIHADCDSLSFLPFKSYLLTGPRLKDKLTGYGKVQEIQSNALTNKFYFEEEHHTAWCKFIIPKSGDLVLKITPYQKVDDIDFLLFKDSGKNLQERLRNHQVKPVRCNMALGDSTINGVTGLSLKGSDEWVGRGKGNPFSTPIHVNKGDTFYLVIDNVKSENGFSLELGIQNEIVISGIAVDENENPVQATVTVTDHTGDIVKQEKTDKNGKYQFKVKLIESTSNTLTCDNDSNFFYSMEINISITKPSEFTDIHSIMPKLKKGNKYQIGLLNFYSNSHQIIHNSKGSLDALYRLMKKNPKMKIRIEGHVNDVFHKEPPAFCQDLSDRRSNTVYEYLVTKGIPADRLEKVGHSCQFPLFPRPVNEAQQQRNRRVEINVLDY